MNTTDHSLTLRTFQPADIPALVGLINQADAVDGFERATTARELEHEMAWPGHQPEVDCCLAWAGDRLAGYCDLFLDTGEDAPWSTFWTWGVVRPDWRRQGVGRRLLKASYRRAEERLPAVTAGPVHFQGTCNAFETGTRELYEGFGMVPVRHFVNLARSLNGDLPPAACPAGYRLRGFDRDRDARAVWQVDVAAFRDHWGATGEPWEAFLHWMEEPHFRPELLFVAAEDATGQVVGIALNQINPQWLDQTGRQEGYVQTLAVLREHRQRGLGSALLAHSLHVLRAEGMESVHLNADVHNLTGAMRLYERQGFQVRKNRIAYRRTLREA